MNNDRKKPGARKPAGKAASKSAKPPRKPAAAETQAGAAAAEPERISKLLARAGIASRRDVERMIAEGRIKLNGEVLATPAVNATFADAIEVDGEPVTGIERTRLWLYHKPTGLVTTNRDPEGRPTVFERLPKALPRVMTVGRLDINTEGLLLLTNDGGLARVLELPTTGWLRRYRVRAHGDIDQARLDKLKDGIAVDGVLYGGIEATLDREQGSNVWITMGLREGKNREIKNVLGALGLEVNRLIRISYGPFQLADLPEGHVLEVRGRMLRDQLGPRLIEEAGADFEAPIVHQAPGDAEAGEKPAARRPQHEKPAERNERLRARLDTRRDDGPGDRKRGGKGDDHRDRKAGGEGGKDTPRKPFGPQRRRASNVWIAPGARPVGPKRAAEKADADRRQAEKDAKRDARGDRADRQQRDGKPGSGRRVRQEDRPRASQPRRHERADAAGADRPQRRTERGEGRDAERPARGGGKPSFGRSDRPRSGPARDGDRPYRADRPAGKGPGARGPARGASARSEGTGEGSPGRPGGAPGKPVRGKGGGAGKPGGRPGKPGGRSGGGGDRPRGPKPSKGPGGADRRR